MAITIPGAPQDSVGPLRLPSGPRLSDNGLGALAQGVSQAVDVLGEVQMKMQRERDTTRTWEASVLLADALRKQEAEWRERRGTAAFGLQDDAVKWWESEPARIAASLENETQRTLFAREVARMRNSSLDALASYEARERFTARNQAADAAIASQISFAAQNFDSPSAVSAARDDILEKIAVQAYLNGWDKNVVEAKKREALTNLHKQVLENMVDVNPEAAQKYLDAVKGEIDGTIWDQLSKTVKTSDTLAQAQRLADDIWGRGLRGTKAYDAARAEAEGEVRERALTLLRTRQQEQDKAVDDYTKIVVDRAVAAFNEGGLAALTPSMISELNRLSPQTLSALRGRAWTPQDKVPTDWETYEALKEQIATMSVGELSRMDFSAYLDKLNSKELDVLTKLRDSRIKGLPDNVSTTQQILNEAHDMMGWTSKDAEKRGLFDRRAREAIDAEQRALGRELRDEEKRKVVDRLLLKGSVPRNWWIDRSAYFFEVQGTPDEAAFQIEVPKAMRRQIEAALKARNIKVDEATVQRYYRAYLDWQEAQP